MWALAGGVICFVLDARCLVSLMLDACFIVHGSWLKAHGSACGLAARLHRSESGPGASPGVKAETTFPGHESCVLSHKPLNIKQACLTISYEVMEGQGYLRLVNNKPAAWVGV